MRNLKLIAKDITDLTVLSTLLQDAVVDVGDMDYTPAAQQFLMVVARLIGDKTEATPPTDASPNTPPNAQPNAWRKKTGVHIAGVESCKHCGVEFAKKHATPLMLLSMTYCGDAIDLVFSGDVMLKLKTPSIEVYAVDLDEEAWPTTFTPCHDQAFTGDSKTP
ncbi:MAG: DUF2948 family protein [Proteobacteria bacterium]|nr:DUF2948 family protein [Pseudomonadota bacterium]